MEDDYNAVMSKRTDEELEVILTIERTQYKPEAIEAAENEIKKRKIILPKVAKSEAVKTTKKQSSEELLQELLQVNKENKLHTEQILKNVKFFFWMTMISIIGSVIMSLWALV